MTSAKELKEKTIAEFCRRFLYPKGHICADTLRSGLTENDILIGFIIPALDAIEQDAKQNTVREMWQTFIDKYKEDDEPVPTQGTVIYDYAALRGINLNN